MINQQWFVLHTTNKECIIKRFYNFKQAEKCYENITPKGDELVEIVNVGNPNIAVKGKGGIYEQSREAL